MPIDESGNLLDQTPNSTRSLDIAAHAPPLYGEHILDQLYADIDQTGIMTPAPQSGMATPFYSQSRSGSNENLAALSSMDGVASSAVRPEALSHRLQNLAMSSRNNSFYRRPHAGGSGGNTPLYHPNHDDSLHHGYASNPNFRVAGSLPRSQPGYFDQPPTHHSNSAPNSNTISRRTSEEDESHTPVLSGTHTPEHIDYSLDLNKVPSYSTAVKTPARGISYTDLGALPNYETAISRPASPVRSMPTSPGIELNGGGGYFAQAPGSGSGSASGTTTPSLDMTSSSGRRSHLGLSSLHPPSIHPHGRNVSESDLSRRLHLTPARGKAH